MNSSSSPPPFAAPLPTSHDVFISFRGEDTRDTFASQLHAALGRKNIETYIDTRPEKGDDIGPAHMEAIEKSKIYVVIFSKNYASSTWCLKELVHILRCKKRYGQIVIPILYGIDTSYLREKKGTYALAGRRLKKRFKSNMDEVPNWRDALEEAANMSEFHYSSKTGRTEADFVEKVVRDVLAKLNRELSSDLKGVVGIEKKIEKIESLLCLDSPGVCCVGIWGMGGIGKTTLADAVFHRHSSKFEVCCFLANVRENSEQTNGLHQLRNKLVGEILKDKDVNIDTPSIPLNILIRLRRTKALIVLDDVNARKQLEVLVGDDDRFCQGSRIIITARDKGLLEQKVDHDKIYRVEGLSSDEALELFHSHAFRNKSPTTDYTDELSREVVDYSGGIPLALKVMGSSFRRCKSKQEWEDQMNKLKRFPSEEIEEVLRVVNMNSSSSPPPLAAPLKDKYDVFINFRGKDTRNTIISHLHKALLRKKIETYMDRKLPKGGEIEPALLEAIGKSKIALVIFSEDYASSTWCLKELVHILGCRKNQGQIVIPIFYRTHPSHVRKQQGTYELKHSTDEVAKWRDALVEAANISGFHDSSKTGTEADFVEEVVQDVLTKLNRELSSDLKGVVGIEKKIENIESLLCLDSPGVCCVGIWGMGGIGKTTLADAVFHRQSSKFEASCFLANVRENSEQKNGLNDLRNTLVRELLEDERVNIKTPSIPPNILIRLRRTKALIVLDDVNARKQLEVLVGDDDRFCQGSRIIITARDKGLLEQKVDHEKIYNVEGLGSDEALELFHSHAFGNKSSTTDYTKLSREVVDYIKGIPLALKVMGSSFRRCKSKQEWEVQWKKVKLVPNGEIQKVLRVSYDGLDDNEKELFLDIACFHKGRMRNYVKECLDSCDFHGEAGINDLIDRSLLSISNEGWSKGQIEMHDLVQEMGRAIAREQRSRLFSAKDVYQVLTNNQGDGHVQAICFDQDYESRYSELEHANFEKIYHLRFLRVSYYLSSIVSLDLPNSLRFLSWDYYPLKSLPSKFSAQNLLVLDMSSNKVGVQFWNEDQSLVNLKRIRLRSQDLTGVPNLSRSLNIEGINLGGCESLVEIPSYFQHLSKLTFLDLGVCTNLKNLPEMPCNLEFLDVHGTAIEELPSSVWSHEKISHLDITYCEHLKSLPSNSCKLKLSGSLSLKGCRSLCEFWELPKDTTVLYLSGSTTLKELRNTSIESVVGLTAIKLEDCKSLVSLPTNIWKLKYLESLDLSGCSNFQHFPEISEVMKHLEFPNLSGTMVKEVSPSIRKLVALRKLHLIECGIQEIPDDLFCLTSLQEFNLSYTEIKSIPASVKQAAQLSRLFLNGCQSLESLPEFPPFLQRLEADGCTSLKTVSSSSTAITQGWEEYIFYLGLYEKYKFSVCPKLDENARSNIMGDAQLRIMRMATASSKFKEDKIEQPSYGSDNSYDDYEESLRKRSFVAIRYSGNEIPNWFSHKSEGCSIKIELPRDSFSTDFLGFALSLVVANDRGPALWIDSMEGKYNFKTSNGESHEVNHGLFNLFDIDANSDSGDPHEVFVWWCSNVFEEVVEGAQSPTAFYKLVTEVNVHFTVLGYPKGSLKAEKCGICLLYGKDAEMIKQRAL